MGVVLFIEIIVIILNEEYYWNLFILKDSRFFFGGIGVGKIFLEREEEELIRFIVYLDYNKRKFRY